MEDLAEAAFKELMAKALGSAWRGERGESSEICPRGDRRLPRPLAPACDTMRDGREGTLTARKEALSPPKEALSPTEALCLSKEASSPPQEALRPPKEAVAHLPLTDRSQNPSMSLERGVAGTSAAASIAIGSGVGAGSSAVPGGTAGPAQAVANPACPAQAAATSVTVPHRRGPRRPRRRSRLRRAVEK